jgi:L-alanine-DL-glutamate epimerase-like enolase superfamily enzyme
MVEATAGKVRGIGYSYTHSAAAQIIRDDLAPVVRGRDVMDVTGTWEAMHSAMRNLGRPGLVSRLSPRWTRPCGT